MQMFSLLYRVFYDRTLFSSYIKNDKGYGIRPLFILTVFVSFCFAAVFFFFLLNTMPRVVSKIVTQLPEVAIENGRIVSPQDYSYSFVSREDNLFFIFNTTGDLPDFKGLPKFGMYISSTALTLLSGQESRRIPISKMLKGASVVLDQANMQNLADRIMSYFRFFVPLLLFLFSLPGIFGFYLLTSFFYTGVSFAFTQPMGIQLSFVERIRLSVLSIMPAYILNAISLLLGSYLKFGFFSVFVTMIYMYCFLKDGQRAVRQPN